MILITDIAWQKILENLSLTNNKNLRISLNNKGCGGSSYDFVPIDDEPIDDETYLEQNGHKIILDQQIEKLTSGSTLDWVIKDQFNQGLDIVNNTQEIGRCGCGESIIF